MNDRLSYSRLPEIDCIFFFKIQRNFCCKDTSSPLLSAHKPDLLAGNNLQPKGQLIFPQLAPRSISIPRSAWSKFFCNPSLVAFLCLLSEGAESAEKRIPCQYKPALLCWLKGTSIKMNSRCPIPPHRTPPFLLPWEHKRSPPLPA